jgi:hypothetical protein
LPFHPALHHHVHELVQRASHKHELFAILAFAKRGRL